MAKNSLTLTLVGLQPTNSGLDYHHIALASEHMVNHIDAIVQQLIKHISHCSGVILKGVSAPGPFVKVWLVMTMTHARVETSVIPASALARLSLVTRIVSTVMAAAVVQKQDLDFLTKPACAR